MGLKASSPKTRIGFKAFSGLPVNQKNPEPFLAEPKEGKTAAIRKVVPRHGLEPWTN